MHQQYMWPYGRHKNIHIKTKWQLNLPVNLTLKNFTFFPMKHIYIFPMIVKKTVIFPLNINEHLIFALQSQCVFCEKKTEF
jgi:hypothetical protein